MESPSDGLDLPDDIIDKVAKANSVGNDPSNYILPEVRASPCHMHTKKFRRSDPFYTPSQISSHFNPKTAAPRNNVPNNSFVDRNISRLSKNTSALDRRTVRSNLPGYMPSKEFVMTWLMYGSDPQGSNHFPDLVKSNGVPKLKNKHKSSPKDFPFGE